MRFSLAALLFSALVCVAQASTVTEVLKANQTASGGVSWQSKAALQIEYPYYGQGLRGEARSLIDLVNGRFVDRLDVPPTYTMNGFDGRHAWELEHSGTFLRHADAVAQRSCRNRSQTSSC